MSRLAFPHRIFIVVICLIVGSFIVAGIVIAQQTDSTTESDAV
jgi:sensor histidine kinase regulating citrate/malate metabolism